nr:MAG TPA: DNA REPAIR HELICASE RAD25, SSL2, PRE-INITIATION COMPLEX, RNA POLYMERASE.0A [Caudoviricetes sp.]
MNEKKVREAIERMCKMRDAYNATLRSLPQKTRERSDYNNYVDAFLVAIEALEKQLPKRPRENGMSDGLIKKTKYYTCQTCGNCLLTEMMNERQNTNYCWDCGQRLDWSE